MRPHDALTEADKALLERLASGDQHKLIAHDLGLTTNGVTMRVRRVVGILGAKTRCHAIALYLAPEKYRKP